ncbi:hypothetical protein QQ045_027716 [Rhodiola kirilowii]
MADEPLFESETQLQRIFPKVIKIVDNSDHCNLEVSVKILRRILMNVSAGEQDAGVWVRSYRFYIHHSTFSNMNSLRIKLHDVLLEELYLQLGESDIVSIAETFNSLMMLGSPCHNEHTTVVVAEFEKRELYRSLYLKADIKADLSMSKMARVEISDTTCPICLDEFAANGVVVVKTPCAHLFHDLCLRNWLKQPRKNGCPMCRAPIQVD